MLLETVITDVSWLRKPSTSNNNQVRACSGYIGVEIEHSIKIK